MPPTPTVSSDSDRGRAPRLRLQHRIVLPLLAAALLSTGIATWIGVRVTSQALRARLEEQLVSAAATVASGDFALNRAILGNVRLVAGIDVVTLGLDGAVAASSLDPQDAAPVAAARRALAAGVRGRVVDEDCGFPCLVTVRPLDGRPEVHAVLVADASALAQGTRAAVRIMFASAVASVLLLLLVSQAVVRRVTAPLDRLVAFVRTLGTQPGSSRAPVGNDEIGALAEAFNGMLDRLDASRAALVRSEKLGLAGLFAARVAHDIRNPLSSVRMQTQLLQAKAAPGSEEREVLTAMLRDVDQVESVVRDLMDLAHPGELQRQPASLNDAVREAVGQVAHQLSYRKIAVQLDLASGLPPVALDKARFKQALLNLLVNASEAMHNGGTVAVSTDPGDGETLGVRICDDGVGIDPMLRDRVFDPFVSTKPEGVGLGLVNVKAVVEGHGGRIALEPRTPRGTCAVIRLPASARG